MGRRLLFYTHGLVGGGAERVWARLAAGMAKRGHDVRFVVDFEAVENRAALGDVPLAVLPRGHVPATRALAAMLRAERPDASLSALAVSNLKHAAAATLAGRRLNAIVSHHGFYETESGARLSHLGYRLAGPIARATGASVAVSRALRDDLIARFGAPAEKVALIHNPAAPEPAPRTIDAAALAARAPLVVAVGRLVPEKGFDALLRAFAALGRRDARLAILGEGPERGALAALARDLGIADRVELRGHVGDVGAALDGARVFALASRRESFSLACVEALAHGLPVVATDCGGPAEILDRPGLGALVPVGDVAALSGALGVALVAPGDPAPRQARAADFGLDAALDRYEALIEVVVSHRPAPA